MNTLIKKNMRWLMVISIVTVMFFITVMPVSSQVGKDALKDCADFSFSTSEDFLSRAPEPPDGNPIISDGDLLGFNHTVCARNADLLSVFEIPEDLGLDAVDVINVESYMVALSTELDSPNAELFFTAGDLVVTNGAIIPNQSLTYLFGIPYDIGLDAVHFIGDIAIIEEFLGNAVQIPRDAWLQSPDMLVGMLRESQIDIWFSTEGTWTPAAAAGFLDGDLLSAAGGNIVLSQDLLLPDPEVPAGIPSRGVDFGLDAVTSDRTTERANVHFSTEILYEGEFSFTDGDLLKVNSTTIALTSADLVASFEPLARMLGLDAVSARSGEETGCVSRLTKIGGVDVADIDLTAGTVNPGVLGYNAPAPFGGVFDLQGTICDDVNRFRVVYRSSVTDPWESIKVLPSKNWTVKTDAFIPPFPDCLGTMGWSSDTDGWFDGFNYRHLSEASLGGCNPGLALAVWDSPSAISGADELYQVMLVADTTGGVFSDTLRTVQLDNTTPIVQLEKEAGVCNTITTTDLTVRGRMADEYFHAYRLTLTGDGYTPHGYTKTAYFDDLTDNVEATGTVSWNSYVDLHDVFLTDLAATPVACGYGVTLVGWDRTLVGSFFYTSNVANRCAGCRHASDTWNFSYVVP